MKGKCKFFNESKGFGFIAGEDDKDYFVHITDIDRGLELTEDLNVTFDVIEGDRGPKTSNVKLD